MPCCAVYYDEFAVCLDINSKNGNFQHSQKANGAQFRSENRDSTTTYYI